MALLFYSMAGEGRGHAARARAVVEHLRARHEVRLFAPDDAYDFLAPLYRGGGVTVERIPGLRFAYRRQLRVDYVRTGLSSLGYVAHLPRLVGALAARIHEERPDLVVTDFEPALPRAARLAGVPFVSLDHQHFLVANDLRALPRRLRVAAALMGGFVRAYYRGQCATIVSSFYAPPLRRDPSLGRTRQIGVVLRPELRHVQPRDEGHLCVYLRRRVEACLLEPLLQAGREVRIYGQGLRRSMQNLVFRGIDEERFLSDLVSCSAIVSTSGNQLVGEALHLGKPVLALCEPGNREQEINGFFLTRSQAGVAVPAERFRPHDLWDFLYRLGDHRAAAQRLDTDGTEAAIGAIESELEHATETIVADSRLRTAS